MNPQHIAINLMILQAFLFAGETMVIHQIGSRVSLMQLALIRGTAGLLLVLLLAWHVGISVARTRQFCLNWLRGAVSLLYLWVMIYSFRYLPFAEATAISYTQVAYIALFSVLILGETVGRLRWIAAALGIFGAVLIAKPALEGLNFAYVIVLTGTSLNGLAFVLNRYLQREDKAITIMFYTNLVLVIGNIPSIALEQLPPLDTWYWLLGISLFGPIGVYAGILAVKHADAATLGPFTLLRLVIALAGGAVIFQEWPNPSGLLGAGLIVASCLASSHVKLNVMRRLPGHREEVL